MNRSNLRSLPTLENSPEASFRAESELVGLFDGLLARGRGDEESPDYDLLEAAVDGTLDPVEAELFASRLAGDPVLQREFDDLVALRQQLRLPAPGTASRPARQALLRRRVGLAAAAVLLAALGLDLRLDHLRAASANDSASQVASAAHPAGRATATPGTSRVVFVDSFEGGTTDHWSN